MRSKTLVITASLLIGISASNVNADQQFKLLRTNQDDVKVLREVSIGNGVEKLVKVAEDPTTSPVKLDSLSRFGLFGYSKNSDSIGTNVRLEVARNPATYKKTLEVMIEVDPNYRVRKAAMDNFSQPYRF
jgi:hypothetical protein